MKTDYSNYSLVNILKLSFAFVIKNPLSLVEMIFYRIAVFVFLYPLILVFGLIFFVASILFIVMLVGSLLSHQPDTKLLTLILVIPLGLIIVFAPIIANSVVETAVFQKYAYPQRKQVSVILTYFQALFQVCQCAFSIDYLICIPIVFAISFLSSQLSLILGSILALYLIFVTLMKIARVSVLPYAKFLSEVKDGDHLSYIKKIPLDMICVMFFYNIVLSNILNTLMIFFKTEKPYLFVSYFMKGIQLDHLAFLIMIPIVTSITTLVQIIYYDVRDKLNFQRSTKLLSSIIIGIAIIFCLIIVVIPFADKLNKVDDYQKDYARYNAALIVKEATEKREGRVYEVFSRIVKDVNLDGIVDVNDLSEKNKKAYDDALNIDMAKHE
jgi:hypothetical protein